MSGGPGGPPPHCLGHYLLHPNCSACPGFWWPMSWRLPPKSPQIPEMKSGRRISFRSVQFPKTTSDNFAVSFYRRDLPHYQRDYKPHFVTFVTKDRYRLQDWARQIVLETCTYAHGKKYSLRVAVVMPDHAHLIMTPSIDFQRHKMYSLHEILRSIKSYSARRINDRLGSRAKIWQDESFDHVLRNSESLDAKVAYILANPVRAGLVNVSADYPWKWERPVEFHTPFGIAC